MSAGFALLQRLLRERSGLALDADKADIIRARLDPILRDAKLSGFDDLARVLHGNMRSELALNVMDALTINETSFFRDRSLFTYFTDRLLPGLIDARRGVKRLRIWCAGCASGQEPYSLAMLIDDVARELTGWRVEIVATDLSRKMIERAKKGLYSQFEVQRGLPVAMLLRHFRREGDDWQISDHLRAKVAFSAQNLMVAKDAGCFDVIFCRNVLIYFDVEVKRSVLSTLKSMLADDGYLALGAAETAAGLCVDLHAQDSNFLFRKQAHARLSA